MYLNTMFYLIFVVLFNARAGNRLRFINSAVSSTRFTSPPLDGGSATVEKNGGDCPIGCHSGNCPQFFEFTLSFSLFDIFRDWEHCKSPAPHFTATNRAKIR